ncbi:type VII toxin-antitoxin system MntA family adenylyltransferase antitoxin [Pseudomaricurvus sp.]|uniref:type VII toxin-antitoxin system MntA family adenylyltransferase antitoxin n=1 Tax=Pseudomaricurvus sp. TaxID=2004510 RepID=UPI003F6B7106
MNLHENQKQRLIEVVQSLLPHYQALYVFGSAASGGMQASSDVDLAILMPGRLSGKELLELTGELSAVLGRAVDLLDMRASDDVINMQVITQGVCLSAPDHFQAELFATHRFSDYVRLNEQRAGILADIKARGSVYG